eukprot:1739886-Amphidinium_carterae.1
MPACVELLRTMWMVGHGGKRLQAKMVFQGDETGLDCSTEPMHWVMVICTYCHVMHWVEVTCTCCLAIEPQRVQKANERPSSCWYHTISWPSPARFHGQVRLCPS